MNWRVTGLDITEASSEKHGIDGFSCVADFFIIFFGTWTLIHQISYFAGLTFEECWKISIFLAPLVAIIFQVRSVGKKWLPLRLKNDYPIILAIPIGILLSITLHRPDADDQVYLAHSLLALDFASERMNSMPGINTGYVLTSYDFIRAAFSYYTGTPILYSFYAVFPAIIAVILVIFQWRTIKLLPIKNVAFAMIVFFIIMLAWGDIHRSPANLGFVKLFQGKGALVWVAIPAMIFYWLQYEIYRNLSSLVLLFFSSICAIGFSPTGIPVDFLMIVLFSLIHLYMGRHEKHFKLLIIISISIIALLVLAGILITNYFGYQNNGIHSSVGVRQLTKFNDYLINWEMMHFVLGNSNRFWLVLFAVIASPFVLPKTKSAKYFCAYILGCIAIALFPFSSALLGLFSTGSFAWRWLFITPFVLCIMIFLDSILCIAIFNWSKRGLVMIYLAAFALSGPLIISEANYTKLSLSLHQLADEKQIQLTPFPYGGNITRLEGSRILSLKDGRPL
jgi:hypothetical protein